MSMSLWDNPDSFQSVAIAPPLHLSMVDPKTGGRETTPPSKTSPPQEQGSRRVGLLRLGLPNRPADRPAAALSCLLPCGWCCAWKDPRNPKMFGSWQLDPSIVCRWLSLGPPLFCRTSMTRRAVFFTPARRPRLPVQTPVQTGPSR